LYHWALYYIRVDVNHRALKKRAVGQLAAAAVGCMYY